MMTVIAIIMWLLALPLAMWLGALVAQYGMTP